MKLNTFHEASCKTGIHPERLIWNAPKTVVILHLGKITITKASKEVQYYNMLQMVEE